MEQARGLDWNPPRLRLVPYCAWSVALHMPAFKPESMVMTAKLALPVALQMPTPKFKLLLITTQLPLPVAWVDNDPMLMSFYWV